MNAIKKATISVTILLLCFTSLVRPAQAASASLFLATSQGTVLLNSVVSLDLFVSSPDQAVNTYDATILFDPSYVKPLFINKAGSLCTIYVRELAIGSNSARVTCGQPSPGFKGNLGKIVMVSFQMIKVGTTSVTVSSGSQVLANDGAGTNILSSTRGVTLNIVSGAGKLATPTITVDGVTSGEWITKNTLTFKWNAIDKAKGYSYTFSRDKNVSPDYTIETTSLSKTLENIKDGTYYFKLRATDGLVASDVQTFVVRIDTTGPKDLTVKLNTCNPVSPSYLDTRSAGEIDCQTYSDTDEDIILGASPIIEFSATDEGSGISHYSFSLDGADFIDTNFQYPLDSIPTGNHTLIVRAYDYSGNYTEKSMIFSTLEVTKPTLELVGEDPNFGLGQHINLSGRADPDVIVLIYLDGRLLGSTFTDQEGNYEYVVTQTLDFGQHEIISQAITSGGVLSEHSDSVFIKIDEDLLAPVSNVIPGFVQYAPLCVIPLLVLFIIILIKRREQEDKEEDSNIEENLQKRKGELKEGLEIIEKAARYGLEREDIVQGMKELEQKVDEELELQKLKEDKEKKKKFDLKSIFRRKKNK